MKLLRYIADKLYKYSSYNKIEAPIYYVKTQNVQIVKCEIIPWEKQTIEETKSVMATIMAKDIDKFIDVEIDYDQQGRKIYRGQIKIVDMMND